MNCFGITGIYIWIYGERESLYTYIKHIQEYTTYMYIHILHIYMHKTHIYSTYVHAYNTHIHAYDRQTETETKKCFLFITQTEQVGTLVSCLAL